MSLIPNSYLIPEGRDGEASISLKTLHALWYAYLILHAGHSFWILFFVHLYSGFFCLISRELLKLATGGKGINKGGLELRIKSCISLFYEVEAEIESFNDLFGSILMYELLNATLNIVTYAFFSIQAAIRHGTFNLGNLTTVIPCLVYFMILNDLGSTASKLNSECRGVIKALERIADLEIEQRTKLKVTNAN
jgi:hypothetical protein